MPETKKRRSTGGTSKRRSSRCAAGFKTPMKRSYWLRGEPCTPSITSSVFKIPSVARRPHYPHHVYANRMLPFRPKGTLGEEADRQRALKKLRGVTSAKKGDATARYFTTSLQGEILKAPLKTRTEQKRTVLEAVPECFFLHFSQQDGLEESIPEDFSTHPLDNGHVHKALGPHKEIFQTDRAIVKTPFRVLDAPELRDDFYYSLIDWSSNNFLAVGLARAVYLWSGVSATVEELNSCDQDRDEVSSVCWSQGSSALAVGGRQGTLQLWNAERKEKLRDFQGHYHRIGCLSWNLNTLATGCRDTYIRLIDHRRDDPVQTLVGHTSEVCGLKWSRDDIHLASGGNENCVNIWDIRKPEDVLWKINEHKAAVKALCWSPQNSSIFVSGGGMKDPVIKTWNLNTMERINHVTASGQVCGLHWSKNVDEIVSIHGYNANCINVWKTSNMECIGSVPKHNSRNVYLTAAPDGQSIAVGSGDESVRFFKIFPPDADRGDEKRSRDKINMTIR